MDIIYRHAQLKKAYATLTNVDCHFDLGFEAGEDLRNKLKAAITATKSAMDEVNEQLSMLDDACDLIIEGLNGLDCDVFEITDLLGVAETIKHHMPD